MIKSKLLTLKSVKIIKRFFEMIKIKPNFVYDEEENKVGAILSINDFEALINELEDYQDYKLINERKNKQEKLYTLEEVIKETEERLKGDF